MLAEIFKGQTKEPQEPTNDAAITLQEDHDCFLRVQEVSISINLTALRVYETTKCIINAPQEIIPLR